TLSILFERLNAAEQRPVTNYQEVCPACRNPPARDLIGLQARRALDLVASQRNQGSRTCTRQRQSDSEIRAATDCAAQLLNRRGLRNVKHAYLRVGKSPDAHGLAARRR